MTHIGARQLSCEGRPMASVLRWSGPIYRAYLAGCWLLHWTDDTLYWIAKPTVHKLDNPRRLHNESAAALESDIEHLYFIHGVMVPAFVVLRPDWITLDHITREENQEVRRIMIERYGWIRYLADSNAKIVHKRKNEIDNQFEQLYEIDGGRVLVVSDPSTARIYSLRVPRDVKSCEDAQRWLSCGLSARLTHRS